MKSYRDYNDFELLDLICELDEDASSILYEKYKPIIVSKAKNMFRDYNHLGLDIDDFIQEGMIGLSEAIRDYRHNKDAKFNTFATICIDRKMNSALVKASRKKHKNLNEAMSLDYVSGESNRTLSDFLDDKNNINPEEYFVMLETERELYNSIRLKLTDLENRIFDLKIGGLSYKQIAEILDKNDKSIDNAIQRIKAKIKEITKRN